MKTRGALRRNAIRVLVGISAWATVTGMRADVEYANFTNEYQSGTFPAGWVYQWNANGSISNTNNYVNLLPSGSAYNTEGDSLPNSVPGEWLTLLRGYMHPGNPAGGGYAYDRYAIAGYTVTHSGPTYLYGSARTPHSNSEGTEVRISVGNTFVASIISPGGADYATPFSRFLGNLNPGDTVYLALGPKVNHNNDGTTITFALGAPTVVPWTILADYQDDFKGPLPRVGWRYMWNENGPIGVPSNYQTLEWASTQNRYETYGDGSLPDAYPGRYLNLRPAVGHPGGSVSGVDYYAIAAFTVPRSGYYTLTDTFLERSQPNMGTGIALYLHVNDDAPLIDDQILTGSETVVFDTELGRLDAGDTVYVCVGPNGDEGSSGFEWDFSIRLIPRGSLFLIR